MHGHAPFNVSPAYNRILFVGMDYAFLTNHAFRVRKIVPAHPHNTVIWKQISVRTTVETVYARGMKTVEIVRRTVAASSVSAKTMSVSKDVETECVQHRKIATLAKIVRVEMDMIAIATQECAKW